MGLAGMFFLTASAHWGRRRADLIRMVPKNFPRPDFLVTLTGTCEILGAIGITIGDKPATPLVARSVMQGIFLMATIAVVIGSNS